MTKTGVILLSFLPSLSVSLAGSLHSPSLFSSFHLLFVCCFFSSLSSCVGCSIPVCLPSPSLFSSFLSFILFPSFLIFSLLLLFRILPLVLVVIVLSLFLQSSSFSSLVATERDSLETKSSQFSASLSRLTSSLQQIDQDMAECDKEQVG